jgi:hypothetical protein
MMSKQPVLPKNIVLLILRHAATHIVGMVEPIRATCTKVRDDSVIQSIWKKKTSNVVHVKNEIAKMQYCYRKIQVFICKWVNQRSRELVVTFYTRKITKGKWGCEILASHTGQQYRTTVYVQGRSNDPLLTPKVCVIHLLSDGKRKKFLYDFVKIVRLDVVKEYIHLTPNNTVRFKKKRLSQIEINVT